MEPRESDRVERMRGSICARIQRWPAVSRPQFGKYSTSLCPLLGVIPLPRQRHRPLPIRTQQKQMPLHRMEPPTRADRDPDDRHQHHHHLGRRRHWQVDLHFHPLIEIYPHPCSLLSPSESAAQAVGSGCKQGLLPSRSSPCFFIDREPGIN